MRLLVFGNIWAYRKHKCFAKTEDICRVLRKNKVCDVTILPVGLDLSIIPEIRERDLLRKNYGVEENACIVLFVGRIDEYKKPLEALKVFELIDCAKEENYRFYVIGTGKLNKEFEEAIRKSSIEHKLVWVKEMPNHRIHDYYKMADYMVNLNDKEIFGMSILEALYQGCSVIARRAPGPNTIIGDNEYGFLITENDEIVEIVSKELKVDSEKAKKHIIDDFSWDGSANILVEWINEKRA